MVNWLAIRSHFPGVSHTCYLNAASLGLVPDVSIKALECFIRQRSLGSMLWLEWYSAVDDIRRLVSKLIGSKPEEIAFVQNTSMGLNLIANSIRWGKGENIVTTDLEFPTNLFPWQVIAKKYGLEIRYVRNIDGALRREDFERAVDEKTRVIAVSWVEFGNGFVNDLEFLSKLARENDALLVVDGIQGAGALRIDVRNIGVDVFVSGFQKWLLGIGSAFLYVRADLLDELEISFAGWLSDKDSHSFEFREYSPSPNAKRFELGSPSFADAIVARESLRFIQNVGIENIEKRDLDLISYLRKRLSEYDDIKFMTPKDNPSPILTFRFRSQDTKAVFEYLLEKNIYVSYRLGGIRVSPHFYNNRSDIDTLLDAIEEYLRKRRT